MKRYLICSADESVADFHPRAVLAQNEKEAARKYLRGVYSKDETFRESVLDLAVNMTFVERFYLASSQEQDRFNKTGTTGTEEEIIKARVSAFFAARPDLGERFVRYMETEDQTLVDDEIFEYIAVNEKASNHGFVVLDPDEVPVVAA